ncbi:hypothetical protein A11S_77 [Micavibrio aeruginosavorus EPB]|uniref:Uncharacterized protein n=1 Tax=Micavibrio aeruginosavorus EPB TaxID=349215 RepID=M4VUN3_9BACT|nr:hypothetical protein A11S_77 [Micavibrio aeruginosavorus EPB]
MDTQHIAAIKKKTASLEEDPHQKKASIINDTGFFLSIHHGHPAQG